MKIYDNSEIMKMLNENPLLSFQGINDADTKIEKYLHVNNLGKIVIHAGKGIMEELNVNDLWTLFPVSVEREEALLDRRKENMEL